MKVKNNEAMMTIKTARVMKINFPLIMEQIA